MTRSCVNSPYTLQGALLAGLMPITYSWDADNGSQQFHNPDSVDDIEFAAYLLPHRCRFFRLSRRHGLCYTQGVPAPTISPSPSFLCVSMNPRCRRRSRLPVQVRGQHIPGACHRAIHASQEPMPTLGRDGNISRCRRYVQLYRHRL
jgi:hypothetical protein